MTTDNRTAASAYAIKQTEAADLITEIRVLMAEHASRPLNWGCVGDLGSVIETLKVIRASLAGDDF